jgi:hypothetical protein
MSTPEQRIRDFYGFDFPEDFFRFAEFYESVGWKPFEEVCNIGMAFPFDVAAGRPAKHFPEHPHWESRYYNDLPEFITIFLSDPDGLHWGYVFDAPGDLPPDVAFYYHSDTFHHKNDGPTLFDALENRLESYEEQCEDEADEDEDWAQALKATRKLRRQLKRFLKAHPAKPRDGSSTTGGARCWCRLEVVFPETRFRPLSVDPFAGDDYDKARPERASLEPALAEALALLRAGYPGAALKLGRDLWPWAHRFPEVYDLLEGAYTALDRAPLIRLMNEARAFRAHCDSQRG